jgi:hypothetical protein
MALTNTPLIRDRQVELDVDRAGVAARDNTKMAAAVRAALTWDAAAPAARPARQSP